MAKPECPGSSDGKHHFPNSETRTVTQGLNVTHYKKCNHCPHEIVSGRKKLKPPPPPPKKRKLL